MWRCACETPAALHTLHCVPQMQRGGMPGAAEQPMLDTAETVYISSLPLLKMLKHGECSCRVCTDWLGWHHARALQAVLECHLR